MAVDRINCHNESDRWLRLHSPILPNYLNSFNFKVHFNLLPVRSKFLDFALDNESLCPFCNLNYETQFHIFGKCTKLNFLWDFLEEVLNIMNMKYPFFVMRSQKGKFDIMNIHNNRNIDVKLILYLSSVVNYHLWKHRNECVHENHNFANERLIKKIMRSVGARNRLQSQPNFSVVNKEKCVSRIEDLFKAILAVFNISFPIDNG